MAKIPRVQMITLHNQIPQLTRGPEHWGWVASDQLLQYFIFCSCPIGHRSFKPHLTCCKHSVWFVVLYQISYAKFCCTLHGLRTLMQNCHFIIWPLLSSYYFLLIDIKKDTISFNSQPIIAFQTFEIAANLLDCCVSYVLVQWSNPTHN